MSIGHRQYWVRLQPVPPESGGGWIATVPALPGCFTQGRTVEEIEANIKDLVPLWMSHLESKGLPIPPSDLDSPAPQIRPIAIGEKKPAQTTATAPTESFGDGELLATVCF